MILNVITMVFKDIKGELWGIDRFTKERANVTKIIRKININKRKRDL